MSYMPSDPVFAEAVRKIHVLSADLKLYEELKAPTIRDFASAPVLESWAVGVRNEPALIGRVQGHPHLGDRSILTSGLYLLDPFMGYARTFSRWYRLGAPAAG